MWRNVLGLTVAVCLVAMSVAGGCGGQIVGADAGDSCTVPGGTYTEHFAPESPQCPTLPDTTYTFNGTTTLTALDAGSPANGCTLSITGCTVSYVCSQVSNGYTTKTTETLDYSSDGTATGKVTETVSGNNVNTSCTYDVTVSKG